MEESVTFKPTAFGVRLKSMIRTDLRRVLHSKHFYILLAAAVLIPILMIVMTSMMAGMETVDPNTGEITVTEAIFTNVWQSVGRLPDNGFSANTASGGMDLTTMCNVDMMFMAVAVFVCLFIAEDFRSGYAKNLFVVRAKKSEYVISKTLTGVLCGALLLLCYLGGAMVGGRIAGLSFDLCGLSAANVVMCMLSKVFLMPVFVSVFVAVSVAAKQKAWLALCGSLAAGMLLFMTVSLVSPLMATAMHVILCLAGGMLFAFALGAVSDLILRKTSLV